MILLDGVGIGVADANNQKVDSLLGLKSVLQMSVMKNLEAAGYKTKGFGLLIRAIGHRFPLG